MNKNENENDNMINVSPPIHRTEHQSESNYTIRMF